MQVKEAIYLAIFVVICCWIIAIANWLGLEQLSTDRYEFLKFAINLCRAVVVTSIIGGLLYLLYLFLNH